MNTGERFPGNPLLGGPSRWDRADSLRHEDGVLERLRHDSSSRVIVVRAGRALVDGDRLVMAGVDQVVDAVHWALLGLIHGEQGTNAVLLAAMDDQSAESVEAGEWAGPREAVARLRAEDAELLVTAVSLAGWLRDGAFCPACGEVAAVRSAGWSRRCVACAREHFPRTDPAVIVAVESPDGEQLLLGANAQWRGAIYSCFAGFVEAGESLEQTIHREVTEEAGVRLGPLRYVSSQAWPYPRSLMIGFRAVALDIQAARPDGEEVVAVRWFGRAEVRQALAGKGEVGMPGPASIAHALIRDWCDHPGRWDSAV